MTVTTRQYLSRAALTREMVDRFLDPGAHNKTRFDTVLGYLPKASVKRDGIDNSHAIYRYHLAGERWRSNYADRPCRTNTYGDSFTQCVQVSDGETWQEYLAAHLGEPIRNFGVGGYGLYQAYRRMLREETSESSAEYVMLNVFSDDHSRSIYKWRWLHVPDFHAISRGSVSSIGEAWSFEANPWAHVRLNPETGDFEECENPYSEPESLYLLCDEDHVCEAFRGDFEVQAALAQKHATDVNTEVLRRTAEALAMPTDFSSQEAVSKTAQDLLQTCALRSSMYIVDRAKAYTQAAGKKLMILLSYSEMEVVRACKGLPRFDQDFVDHLARKSFLVVDGLQKHEQDFKTFSCSPEEYARRYYIGHYSPQGNHFFAFAAKDAIVEWLDLKPPTYRPGEGQSLETLAATST